MAPSLSLGSIHAGGPEIEATPIGRLVTTTGAAIQVRPSGKILAIALLTHRGDAHMRYLSMPQAKHLAVLLINSGNQLLKITDRQDYARRVHVYYVQCHSNLPVRDTEGRKGNSGYWYQSPTGLRLRLT
jgi:hypothetical protein